MSCVVLCIVLFSIVHAVNWLYISFRRTTSSTVPAAFLLPPSQPHPHTSHPHSSQHQPHPYHYDNHSDVEDDYVEYEISTKPCSARASRDLTPQFTAAETLSSTPSKASAAAGHARCVAVTHSGIQCRLRSIPGTSTCHRHS